MGHDTTHIIVLGLWDLSGEFWSFFSRFGNFQRFDFPAPNIIPIYLLFVSFLNSWDHQKKVWILDTFFFFCGIYILLLIYQPNEGLGFIVFFLETEADLKKRLRMRSKFKIFSPLLLLMLSDFVNQSLTLEP